jgi:hypothetical protein
MFNRAYGQYVPALGNANLRARKKCKILSDSVHPVFVWKTRRKVAVYAKIIRRVQVLCNRYALQTDYRSGPDVTIDALRFERERFG